MGSEVWNPAKGGPSSTEIGELARSHAVASVLDVGCGWGRNLAAFSATARALHGFDTDRDGVLAARNRLAGSGADVRLWIGDLRAMPLRRRYELVICYGVLHFLTQAERTTAYDALASWTAPGGLLAIASFNAAVPIPDDLRPLMPEPPEDSDELRDQFTRWEPVMSRSHVYEDEHEGGIRHTHSIDRLIVRAPTTSG